MRMVRSGPGEEAVVRTEMVNDVLRWLPPPAAGVIPLRGAKTRKAKRGRQHPVGHFSRANAPAPDPCGLDLVWMMACGDRLRVPVALASLDPDSKGHHNLVLRHRRKTFALPSWGRQGVGTAEAGLAAQKTRQPLDDHHWTSVLARPRTRQFTHRKSGRELGHHLPNSCSRRRASSKPAGRRHDDGVVMRHATLNHWGECTLGFS